MAAREEGRVRRNCVPVVLIREHAHPPPSIFGQIGVLINNSGRRCTCRSSCGSLDCRMPVAGAQAVAYSALPSAKPSEI